MTIEGFDKVIIGAGLYGLYAALFCCIKGQKVIVLECEDAAFKGLLLLIKQEFIRAITTLGLFLLL